MSYTVTGLTEKAGPVKRITKPFPRESDEEWENRITDLINTVPKGIKIRFFTNFNEWDTTVKHNEGKSTSAFILTMKDIGVVRLYITYKGEYRTPIKDINKQQALVDDYIRKRYGRNPV